MVAMMLIKGLRCPWNSHSPCYATETDGLAQCGTSGCVFPFEREMQDNKPVVKLVIANGRHEEVPVYRTQRVGDEK